MKDYTESIASRTSTTHLSLLSRTNLMAIVDFTTEKRMETITEAIHQLEKL
ncbi:MAG: hypothetical protein O3B41_10545 [Bacteroidetes bacterium]|nr:hypothetical protein [Bacteroidota bacterium]